jgi:hypothetical protein
MMIFSDSAGDNCANIKLADTMRINVSKDFFISILFFYKNNKVEEINFSPLAYKNKITLKMKMRS